MEPSKNVQQWIELSRKYGGNPGEARALSIVLYGNNYYFVDDRLRSLRNVEDIMDSIKFNAICDMYDFVRTSCKQVT